MAQGDSNVEIIDWLSSDESVFIAGYTHDRLRSNPAVSIAVGVVMLVIGFLVPGTTREVILRVAGVLAILAGAIMWVARRRS